MDPDIEVFLLEHIHSLPHGEESVKTIGIYSTHEAAQEAIERLRRQPGFRDTPDGFCIDRYILGMDGWSEGFVTVGGEE
jgi:homoserine kinase type II